MTREDLDRGEHYAIDLNGRLSDRAMREVFELAREALEARETYRVEVLDEAWVMPRSWQHGLNLDAARVAARYEEDDWQVRIVRERDGEVVT